MKKTLAAALALVGLLASNVLNACEYHNGPSFGAFGAGHRFIQPAHDFRAVPEFTMTHKQLLTVNKGENQSVVINYNIPHFYKGMNLQIKAAEQVLLHADSEVTLEGRKGQYILSFQAQESGKHDIEIEAVGTKDGQPYSLVQLIQLTVI
ncbi:hypothetical protein [Paraferrimonas sp. SM1919]|uniref:hypothetical protein n=1 Tax=Paraferrimonas sp. SM1919 TaxID=2662263 RepID=UPI0013D69920|nr:hypothetical protein [Paraferrimonas sp. SM1919]